MLIAFIKTGIAYRVYEAAQLIPQAKVSEMKEATIFHQAWRKPKIKKKKKEGIII